MTSHTFTTRVLWLDDSFPTGPRWSVMHRCDLCGTNLFVDELVPHIEAECDSETMNAAMVARQATEST